MVETVADSNGVNPFGKVKEVIGGYSVHPVASKWPIIITDEMVDDIRENGIRQEIVVDENNLVIDGRTRLTIHAKLTAEDLDYKSQFPKPPVKRVNFDGYWLAVMQFVTAANNYRRHMNQDARVLCHIEAEKLCEDKLAWDHAQRKAAPIAESFATGIESAQKKKGTQVKEGEKKNPAGANQHKRMARPDCDEPSKPTRNHKAENKNSTRGKLADELGVSRRKVDQALVVSVSAPEVVHQAVIENQITLAQAEKIVKDKEVLAKVSEGKVTPAEGVKTIIPKSPKVRVIVKDGDIERFFSWLEAATVADVQRIFDKCKEILN